jgi:Mn-dependent DtxR family transcriptional regulator
MLEELLRRLAQGGTRSLSELARELGVSDELLGQMIEDLARRGYLRSLAGSCDDRCACCPLAGTCTVGGLKQIWTLTEKGNRAAKLHL